MKKVAVILLSIIMIVGMILPALTLVTSAAGNKIQINRGVDSSLVEVQPVSGQVQGYGGQSQKTLFYDPGTPNAIRFNTTVSQQTLDSEKKLISLNAGTEELFDEQSTNGLEYLPQDNSGRLSNSQRHYRPELEVDLSENKVIDTPQGVTNTEISDAVQHNKRVNFMGTVFRVILHTIGEILLLMVFVYTTLYLLTRTVTFIPHSWIRTLSGGRLDAYETPIRKFMASAMVMTGFGVLFLLGYVYDFITYLIAKVLLLLNLV